MDRSSSAKEQNSPVMICSQHTQRVTSANWSSTSRTHATAELPFSMPRPKAASEAMSAAKAARVLCSLRANIWCAGTTGIVRPLEPGVVKSRLQVPRNSSR